MVTGDAAYIKKINRSFIISKIIEEEMISRADLSKATALTRATISAQVADLIEEGLIIETNQEHNAVGRKPIMLSLNGKAGYALGIDLDYGQISFVVTDLLGCPLSSHVVKINTATYSEVVQILMDEINHYKSIFSDARYGIVGVVIGIHGLVSKDEVIHYVPRFNWHDIPLKTDLEKKVGLNIHLENNANLSSFAERVYVHHHTEHLLCTTLYSGIGLGMMIDNEIFKGNDGFAGEMGHMIIVPEGRPCECGNKGCFEQYASEASIFKQFAEKRRAPDVTYADIQKSLDEGDEDAIALMEQFIYYLSLGLNNMINLYNPDVIVLDSELLRMYPDSMDKIKNNLTSSINHYDQLLLSTIGKESCNLGACALAIKRFLDIPMLNLSYHSIH